MGFTLPIYRLALASRQFARFLAFFMLVCVFFVVGGVARTTAFSRAAPVFACMALDSSITLSVVRVLCFLCVSVFVWRRFSCLRDGTDAAMCLF